MKTKFRVSIIVLGVLVLLTSCSNYDSNKISSDLNNKMNKMQADLNEKDKKIKQLEEERTNQETVVDTVNNKELNWMEKTNWDKIKIYYPEFSESTEIKDKDFFLPSIITGEIVALNTRPEIANSSVIYSYEFIKGSEKYRLDITSDHTFVYKGKEFKTLNDVTLFGRAFMPKLNDNLIDPIWFKILDSQIIKENTANIWSTRFDQTVKQKIILYLFSLMKNEKIIKVAHKPNNSGKEKAKLIFYYYGIQINMVVFNNIIKITDDSKTYWFKNSEENNFVGAFNVS